jgi:hypothetical protein
LTIAAPGISSVRLRTRMKAAAPQILLVAR